MPTDTWIEELLPSHRRLTNAAVSIIENLLQSNEIDYLSVSGRTKDPEGIREKIRRKGYKSPKLQLTDISGVRIILYLEADIARVSKIISDSFRVDTENSSNKDALLLTDRVGYRSTHFVCDLGKERDAVPEYKDLSGLKLEFQIRTVLQHAWAELSHDREYKFSGVLPPDIQRKLFLYAGLLEIADRGFDEISAEIDQYTKEVKSETAKGKLNVEINSITLNEFFSSWSKENKIRPIELKGNADISILIDELNSYGIHSIEDLSRTIPSEYANAYKSLNEKSNIFGIVRDWMIVNDHRKLATKVKINWTLGDGDAEIIKELMSEQDYDDLVAHTELWD